MANDKPNILNIAGGVLVGETEVPNGENVDWDIFAEEMVRLGFPPGMISEVAEKAKTDPKVAQALINEGRDWQKKYQDNPDLLEKLKIKEIMGKTDV